MYVYSGTSLRVLRFLRQTYYFTVLYHVMNDGASVLLTQYCAGDKIAKNEMGWACGAYG